jgi:putative ABC transport system substrate-binding protein
VAGGVLVLLSAIALAQTAPRELPRVVLINDGVEATSRPFVDRFLKGMGEHGQLDGKTFRLQVLYANRDTARSATLIGDAVVSNPDVLMVSGVRNARRAKELTSRVPVVVWTSGDLVDAGVVASFARPGGNITGVADLIDEAAAKRLELLKEFLPKLLRVALLNNPDSPQTKKIESRVRAAANALKVSVYPLYATDSLSIARAIESMKKSPPDALLIGGDPLFVVDAQAVIDRAAALGVPVVHFFPGAAEMGAFFSYHSDLHGNMERTAYYVDRILKGVKPSDLPVEQPTRYEFVINQRAAARFGITTIPSSIRLRADRVIE